MGADGLSGEWLVAIAFVAVCAMPGAGLAALATRRVRLDVVEFAGLSITLTIAALSAVATLVHFAGGGLWLVALAWALAVPAGTWALAREWRAGLRARVSGEAGGLWLVGAVGLLAAAQRPYFFSNSDIFYHVAAVRSLVTSGRVFPTDPIYGTATTVMDPTSGVWHTLQAAFAMVSARDAVTVYAGALAVGALVLACGLWSLLRRVTGDPLVAHAVTLVSIALIHDMDIRTAGYPNQVSFGTALLAIALFSRLIDQRSGALVLLAAAAAFATETMHLGSAQLVLVAGAVVAAFTLLPAAADRGRPRTATPAGAGRIAFALAAGTLPALAVMGPRLVALRGSTVLGEQALRILSRDVLTLPGGLEILRPGSYSAPVLVYFFAVACAAAAAYVGTRRNEAGSLTAGAVGLLPGLLLNDPLITPLMLRFSAHMAYRLALLTRFSLLLGPAWVVGRIAAVRPWTRRWIFGLGVGAGAMLMVLSFVGFAPLEMGSIADSWTKDVRSVWGADALAAARREIGYGTPAVAGGLVTTYQATGLLPVRAMAVLESHSPYHVEVVSGEERRADAETLMRADTSEATRRAILARWDVRYVVIGDSDPERETQASMLAQPGLFEPVVSSPGFTMLRVAQTGP
jgi:hypothetical protein